MTQNEARLAGHLNFMSNHLSVVGNKRILQFFDSANAPHSQVIPCGFFCCCRHIIAWNMSFLKVWTVKCPEVCAGGGGHGRFWNLPVHYGHFFTSIAGNLYCQATAKSSMLSFCQRFHKKQSKFCFHKTHSCLISGNNISLIDIDAIAVFLNPPSSYTYQSLSKLIKI